MTTGIYMITSPSNKIYIGSSINIEKNRFGPYKRLDCKKQIHLYNSLAKYSPENHSFEVIFECKENELSEVEQFFINFLEPELNICKEVCSSRLGVKCSEETKMKLSKINIGKKHSEETKKKISEAGKGNKGCSKPVLQYSKDGTFIAEYFGAAEAGRQTNIGKTNISKCCSEKFKTAGGYIWKYKENN